MLWNSCIHNRPCHFFAYHTPNFAEKQWNDGRTDFDAGYLRSGAVGKWFALIGRFLGQRDTSPRAFGAATRSDARADDVVRRID